MRFFIIRMECVCILSRSNSLIPKDQKLLSFAHNNISKLIIYKYLRSFVYLLYE